MLLALYVRVAECLAGTAHGRLSLWQPLFGKGRQRKSATQGAGLHRKRALALLQMQFIKELIVFRLSVPASSAQLQGCCRGHVHCASKDFHLAQLSQMSLNLWVWDALFARLPKQP